MNKKHPQPPPVSKEMVPFAQRSDWEKTISQINNTFFGGNAPIEWELQFYALIFMLGFTPDLYFSLYEKCYVLGCFSKWEDVAEMGYLWKLRDIYNVCDLKKYTQEQEKAAPVIVLLQNKLKEKIPPFSEQEEKAIVMTREFGFFVQEIDYALQLADFNHQLSFSSVFSYAEEWFLEGCKTVDDIHLYVTNKSFIVENRKNPEKITFLPLAPRGKTKH